MIEELDTLYGKMFVPSTDMGQYWWLKNALVSPEHEQIETIINLLKERPKGIFLDCGANFGCWSLALAPYCTRVIAFEPQPGVADLLWRSMNANQGLHFTLRQCALGAKAGFVDVPVLDLEKDANFGGVEMNRNDWGVPSKRVSMKTLDSMDFEQAGRVSFIKADVEGGEYDLFKGAEKLILRDKPIIVAEADHPRTDTDALGAYIESLGYNVELIQGNNFLGMPV